MDTAMRRVTYPRMLRRLVDGDAELVVPDA
jgi:hypothetical protein